MGLNDDLNSIRVAALAAADAFQAVTRFLCCDGDQIQVPGHTWSLRILERVWVIAVGKASVAMADAAAGILGPHLTAGVVVTKYGHSAGHTLPASLALVEAGHPLPDQAGVDAARQVVHLLETLGEHDLVILCISGGASALLPFPADTLSLQDLQVTTELLLRAGASIDEINCVRKHLSQLKGGQLMRRAFPASVLALILSDVVGDSLDVIASGLTVADTSAFEDAWDVLARYQLDVAVPSSVREHLQQGCKGLIPETPKSGDIIFEKVVNTMVASNRMAALAAVAEARRRGYRSVLLSTFVEGEAREVARVTVALARSIRAHGDPVSSPACIVWGGETTVTVRGQGKGGRNQELALAAAIALEGLPDVALLALATDGSDGPTDAAGAVVDGTSAERMRAAGWQCIVELLENNAYPALDSIGALLKIGPTGTNVNDLTVLLVG